MVLFVGFSGESFSQFDIIEILLKSYNFHFFFFDKFIIDAMTTLSVLAICLACTIPLIIVVLILTGYFDGATGDKGPIGDRGPRGPKGPIGDKGPQGPQGIKGPQGPIGNKGPVGDKGPQGAKGVVGNKGPDGNLSGFEMDNGSMFLNDKGVFMRKKGDRNHGLHFLGVVDGPVLFGNQGVSIAAKDYPIARFSKHHDKLKIFPNGKDNHPYFYFNKLGEAGMTGGNWSISKKNLCLGNTCINEEHLKMLTGKRHFFLKHNKYNRYLHELDGKASFSSGIGERERMSIYNKDGKLVF